MFKKFRYFNDMPDDLYQHLYNQKLLLHFMQRLQSWHQYIGLLIRFAEEEVDPKRKQAYTAALFHLQEDFIKEVALCRSLAIKSKKETGEQG